MQIPIELIGIFATATLGVVGWVATEMRNLSNSINDLATASKVIDKTIEVINDGMLENRKHIGELFSSDDAIHKDIARIQGKCEVHHGKK